MISALAKGGAVLEEPRYAAAARRAAEFLIAHLYQPESGVLLRRYRDGDAAIPGFLDDYALFMQALLDLYEAQFDRRHLDLALRLTEKQRELFEDAAQGAFFSSAAGDSGLVLRVKEDYDGAEPSGNSVAFMNLLRLAEIANRQDLRASAERLLAAFAARLTAAPVALPYMLAACEFRMGQARQIVLVGEPRCRRYRGAAARPPCAVRAASHRAAGGFPGSARGAIGGHSRHRRHGAGGWPRYRLCLPRLRLPDACQHAGGLRRVATILNRLQEKENGGAMERPGATTMKGKPLTLIGPELKAGDAAPDFHAVDNGLKPVNLHDTGNQVRIISVVPSLDTPVCDAQTKRFNEEAAQASRHQHHYREHGSAVRPEALVRRFRRGQREDALRPRGRSFGSNYGTLIKELRIESRAIFVVDRENKIRYAEYVKEVADHPELRSGAGRCPERLRGHGVAARRTRRSR